LKESWESNFQFAEPETGKEKVGMIKIEDIEPNPFQPRRSFPPEKLQELTQSIKTYGLLQPVMVRRSGRGYQLVVGERRLLACKSLGWKNITATIKELSDSAMATIALIENLQREDLNYIEEAEGYARLMDQFNLTQEVLAQRLGKSQSTIANKLRLLKLPDSFKKALLQEKLTERHARALLKLNSQELQQKVVQDIIDKGLTVSQTEIKIERLLGRENSPASKKIPRAVVRDFRIFLNTIREAVKIIEDSGLTPEVNEKVEDDFVEVTIRLFKK
jgi:ParB family transcriptional regulator, chromosome partitioning protein